MAISIPKEFRDMLGDNDARNAQEHYEKMRYMQEMERRMRGFGSALPKREGQPSPFDPYYLEEQKKAHLLQQAMLKKKEEEEHRRLLRKLMAGPAMQCTVTDGVNLWIAKFGDGWVDRNAIPAVSKEGDMEWTVLADRLRKINMMEEYDNFVRIRT